jgi:hypothetical protein
LANNDAAVLSVPVAGARRDHDDVADVVAGIAGGPAGAPHERQTKDCYAQDEEASHEALRIAEKPPVQRGGQVTPTPLFKQPVS